MTQKQLVGRRGIALFLSALLLFSCLNGALVQSIRAVAQGDVTITEGQLVSSNYASLTAAEKALLNAALLKEDSFSYDVPQAGDNLVTVDSAAKTITAKPITKSGYLWYPAYAIVESGGNKESVGLVKTGETYLGTFETDGNTYSVSVTYDMKITVSAAKQNQLLSAGKNFKDGLANLNTIADSKIGLDALAENIDKMQDLVVGYSYFGMSIKYDGPGSLAITALYNQKQANGGKFDLTVMIEDYNAAVSKTQYLMENGVALFNKARETAAYMTLIAGDKENMVEVVSLAESFGVDVGFTSAELTDALDVLDRAAFKLNQVTGFTWAVHANNPLKDGMTPANYLLLDALIGTLPETQTAVTVTEELKVAPVTIKVNMNRYNVTVKVVGQVIAPTTIGSNALTRLEMTGDTLVLDKNASAEDVAAAIAASGIEALARDTWGIDLNYYTVEVTGNDGALTADRTVTITYTPKKYTVSGFTGLPTDPVYYGYNVKLPTHSSTDKVYDYVANGVSYMQGEIYTVTGDTVITRTEGDPWTEGTWNAEVSAVLGKEAAAVLGSAAVKADKLNLRIPSNKLISVRLEGGRYVVSAPTYNSGIPGLSWVADNAAYVTGDVETPFDIAEGFVSADFDKVNVTYKLELTGLIPAAEVLNLMNLPHVLTTDYAEQKAQMNELMSTKATLEKLNRSILRSLATIIEDDNAVTPAGKAALDKIINECVNPTTGSLYLYEYLVSYESDGMVWYYTGNNFETLNAEFIKLRDALNIFLTGNTAIEGLLNDFGMGEYYTRLDELMGRLNAIVLVAPNAAINRNASAAQLNELAVNLQNALGKTQSYTEAQEIVKKKILEAAAPNKALVNIQVILKDSTGRITATKTLARPMIFALNHVLTAQNILDFNAALAELENTLNISATYYTRTGEMLTAGTTLTENVELTFVWQPVTVSVEVEGSGNVSFTQDNPYIVLPGTGNSTEAYKYNVGGTVYNVTANDLQIALTQAQMDSLVANGKITRTVVDLVRQSILDLVKDMNNALSGVNALNGAAFIAVENADGKLAIILKVSPLTTGYNKAAMATAIVETLVASGYSYITLDGNVIMNTQVYIQGIIDTLLNSGLSLDNIAAAINNNGTINNMNLNGYDVVPEGLQLDGGATVPNANTLGGLLYKAPMSLAYTDTVAPMNVDLYITLGDDGTGADTLKKLDSGIATLKPYLNVLLEDGNAKLILNLPEKAYHAFLAAMLMTDNVELGDLNNLDYGVCIKYLYELVEPVLKDTSITTDTLENTLGALGVERDLSAAKDLLRTLQKVLQHIYGNVDFSNGAVLGDTYFVDAAYPADILLGKLPVSDNLLSLVAEKGQNLNAGFGICLKNLNTKYQALVMDMKASGANKVTFVTDAAAAIAAANKYSLVILVDDVTGDLAANNSIILDLNGNTVNGNVSGSIHLMDSTIGDQGVVNGTVNVARDYRNTNMYEVVIGENGDVNIYLNCGLLNLDQRPGIINMATELAMDLIMNYYASAALSLNGNVIYSIDLSDMIGMLEDGVTAADVNELLRMIDGKGVANFLKGFLKDILNFPALWNAAKNDKALLSYTVGTKSWDLKLSHNTADDVITGGAAAGTKEEIRTFNILLGGELKDREISIELLEKLSKYVDVDVDININDFYYEDKEIYIDGDASISVDINLSEHKQFPIALAVLLANSKADNADILAAIADYYNTGSTAALKTYLDNTSVRDVFAAIKQVNRTTDYAAMVDALGLDGVVETRVVEIMEASRLPLAAAAKVLNRYDITGTTATLGQYEMSTRYGVYCLDKELEKAGAIKFLGGKLALSGKLTVSLFGVEPSFEGNDPAVQVDGENILGVKVDKDNKLIFLDVKASGLTTTKLVQLVSHNAKNADRVTVQINAAGVNGTLVRNGAQVTFTAYNDLTDITDVITYTVIILGDVNCNGVINVTDATAIAVSIRGGTLSTIGALAADCNMNGKINVTDAVIVQRKVQNNYDKSVLG